MGVNTLLGYQTFPAWQETTTCFSGKCCSPPASSSLLSSLPLCQEASGQGACPVNRDYARKVAGHLLEVDRFAAAAWEGGTSHKGGPQGCFGMRAVYFLAKASLVPAWTTRATREWEQAL